MPNTSFLAFPMTERPLPVFSQYGSLARNPRPAKCAAGPAGSAQVLPALSACLQVRSFISALIHLRNALIFGALRRLSG